MRKPRRLVALLLMTTVALVAVATVALLPGQVNASYAQKEQWPGSSKILFAVAEGQVGPGTATSVNGKGGDLWSKLQPFAPVTGAIVALMALVGTTIQYLRDRKRERGLRIEEGIAESTNKLTAFSGSTEMGIGTVVAALRNLRGFVGRSGDATALKAQITEILAAVVREDIDYGNARQARFDSLCFQYWEDHKRYQSEHPVENIYILDQYLEALDGLEQKSNIVKIATFTSTGIRNIPKDTKNSEISHLTRLVAGYGLRLSLLPGDEAQEAERRFFEITGRNASLRDQMLSSRKADEMRSHAEIG
jgi:hypothetical protein